MTGTPMPLGSRRPPATDRVRVLQLLPDLRVGGGQAVVLGLLSHLDPGRFDVRVATLADPADMCEAFAAAGFPPVELQTTGRLGAVATVARLIRRERFDIVHVHSPVDRAVGHLAALASGIPVVGHLHSEWVHLQLPPPSGPADVRRLAAAAIRARVERRAVRHYVAASGHVRDLFDGATSVPITVLPPATSLVAAAPTDRVRVRRMLGIDEQSPVLLHIARIVEGKGHADLVPLTKEVRSRYPDVRMLVVGTGDLEQAFRRTLARDGLDDAVKLLGQRDDIPALLGAADVLVFPSYSEGMGLVVLEAMAAGLPVVAYALPAFGGFARDGESGIFAPVGAHEDLTKAVLGLLGDGPGRAVMGRTGRVTVEERFRWPNAAAVLAGVYEQVMAMRSSR